MISVLLAAYNGAFYIREQLDSIIEQTWKDIKIVISDDGSTDGTLQAIKEYAARYPEKISILESSGSSGKAWKNFFRLLTYVEDGYVMFCDQDDVWLPDKVELTMKRMKKLERRYGAEIPLLVHSDLKVVDRELKTIHESMAVYQKLAVSHKSLNHYLVENNITGSTVMINHAFRRYFSYVPEECVMHDWWLGLLASSFGKISYINQPLALYRQHGNNQLGAESSRATAVQLAKRLRTGEAVRENYRLMFKQASLFLSHYADQLTGGQRELLEHFIRIPKMSRSGKIYTILKYHLFKSTPARTLGQMFSI